MAYFRRTSGSLKTQKVPSWTGCLSQTVTDNERTISTVEYMALLSENINENSTVQYTLDQFLAASQEVGQEYAIVTIDLAVAKKAYALVWQSNSQNGCFPHNLFIIWNIGENDEW